MNQIERVPSNVRQILRHRGQTIYFHFSTQDMSPSITYDGKTFTGLLEALACIPDVNQPSALSVFAQIVNFLGFAGEYVYIGDPGAFKERYRRRVNRRGEDPTDAFHRFGPFDVSEIDQPKLESGHLVFWVYSRAEMVPYRVRVPMPLHSSDQVLDYRLLPYATEGGRDAGD